MTALTTDPFSTTHSGNHYPFRYLRRVQKPSAKAWIYLIILALIWGSSFILIKKGLVGLSSGEVGSLRILAASVFLLPIAILRLKRVSKPDWKFLASVGLLGSLIPSFLFAIAQTKMDSGVTGVLNALTPLCTVLIGLIIYKQSQTRGVFLGILIGLLGSVVLSFASSTGAFSFNFYALFVVGATICYGFNLNIIKHHLGKLQALTVTSISLLFAGPLALIHLLVFTDFFQTVISSPEAQLATGYILILGIMGTAIALIIFNNLVQITDPVFTSSVTYLIPLVAVTWGVLDGEILEVGHFAGMITILLGVYITNRVKAGR